MDQENVVHCEGFILPWNTATTARRLVHLLRDLLSAGRFLKLQRSAMAMARVAKEKGSARSKDGEEPVAMAMAGVCSLNSFGLDL